MLKWLSALAFSHLYQVKMLKSRRGHEAIYFEDISSPDYSPRRNSGISYADAMDTIHVIKKDGSVVLVRTCDMFFTGPRP